MHAGSTFNYNHSMREVSHAIIRPENLTIQLKIFCPDLKSADGKNKGYLAGTE